MYHIASGWRQPTGYPRSQIGLAAGVLAASLVGTYSQPCASGPLPTLRRRVDRERPSVRRLRLRPDRSEST